MNEKQEEVVPQFMVVPPNVLEEMKRNGQVNSEGELQGRSIEQVKAGIEKERVYKRVQFEKEVEAVMHSRPGWSRRRARRHVMRGWSKL